MGRGADARRHGPDPHFDRPTRTAKEPSRMSTEPQEASVTGAGEQPVSPDVAAVIREQKARRTSTEIVSAARTVKLHGLHAYHGDQHAVKGVSLTYAANEVTAMIGPSGCGKSTIVRCINRMHEEIPGARAEGRVLLDDEDVYGGGVDVVSVRRTIGMVFQKPNPFPTMSIFDNVAAGLRLSGGKRGDVK